MHDEVWECTECGGTVTAAGPPAVCPECGIAGVVYVEADHELDDQPERRWLREGLESGEFRES